MKTQFNKWTAWLLTLVMITTMLPSFIFTVSANDDPYHSVCASAVVTYIPETDLPDNDTLFAAYVEQMISPWGGVSFFGSAAGDRLSGDSKELYTFLKGKIEAIAAGDTYLTKFISSSNVFQKSFTAEELGVDSIVQDNAITEAAANAASQKFCDSIRFDTVIDALLHDCPYDLYWFDKTAGTCVSLEFESNGVNLSITSMEITFFVAENYQDDNNTWVALTTAAVNTAANTIIDRYENSTDYEKLLGYKNEICDLTAYNEDAAKTDYDGGYGDPWQLIYVFDGNSATNVVCEGYAKAFQYLCDLGELECYTVTGTMSGGTGEGKHMWNIVTLDEKNYLVDVTNSDEGSVGENGGLFLAGTSNCLGNGYVFEVGGRNVSFIYDLDTIGLWGTDADSILILADTSYLPSESTSHSISEIAAKAPTCTEDGNERYFKCTDCGKFFSDVDGTQEIEENSWIITAIGEHSYTVEVEGTKTPSTCTETGSVTMKCSECDATEVQTLVKDPNNHIGNTHTENTKDATCREEGYTGDTVCECGAIVSTGAATDKAAHSFTTKASNSKASDASCTEAAAYYVQCDNCDAVSEEKTVFVGDANGHSYSASMWAHDSANHWNECGSCTEKLNTAAHTPGASATETTSQNCTVCGYEIAPALGHTHSYGAPVYTWSEDHSELSVSITCSCSDVLTDNAKSTAETTEASCTEDGKTVYTATVTLNGTEYTNTKEAVIPSSGHSFNDIWQSDAESHWKVCHCDAKGDEEAHSDTNSDTRCDVCEYVVSAPSPSDPDEDTVYIPIVGEGEDAEIRVEATVSDNKATVKDVVLESLDNVLGGNEEIGTITIDFSDAVSEQPITTVEIPSDVIEQIADAVNNPSQSLEIVLSDGASIEFDAAALRNQAELASGSDITISFEDSNEASLTPAQEAALNGRPAYDITVTSDGEPIANMGGMITLHAPYVLKDGEHPDGIIVRYVDDNGRRECCETSYDSETRRVSWKTDHLSLYMIDHEESDESENEESYWLWLLMMRLSEEFDITATASEGGSITPEGLSAVKFGKDLHCTITPDEGYRIAAVLIDDESIGAVSEYTFDNVKEDHTISVIFEKIPWQNPFTDIRENDWYYEDVAFVCENGLMIGTDTSGTVFSPDGTLTRGMLVTILWRIADRPCVNLIMPYTDVDENEWYAEAVRWAGAVGIVLGYGDGTFGPEDLLTREQLATILYRFEQYLGGGFKGMWMFPLRHSDAADVSDWAYEAICFMTMHDIYVTREDGCLAPAEYATRAQTAAMLARYCKNRDV